MKCSFDRRLNVSIGNGIEIIDNRNNNWTTFEDTATSSFKASMNIYTTSSFLQVAQSPFSVTLNQPIYLGIKQEGSTSSLKFVVTSCHATPSAQRINRLSYPFFYDKCPLDQTFKTIQSTNNEFRFTIDAFRFISINKAVYLHCHLYVCFQNSIFLTEHVIFMTH